MASVTSQTERVGALFFIFIYLFITFGGGRGGDDGGDQRESLTLRVFLQVLQNKRDSLLVNNTELLLSNQISLKSILSPFEEPVTWPCNWKNGKRWFRLKTTEIYMEKVGCQADFDRPSGAKLLHWRKAAQIFEWFGSLKIFLYGGSRTFACAQFKFGLFVYLQTSLYLNNVFKMQTEKGRLMDHSSVSLYLGYENEGIYSTLSIEKFGNLWTVHNWAACLVIRGLYRKFSGKPELRKGISGKRGDSGLKNFFRENA